MAEDDEGTHAKRFLLVLLSILAVAAFLLTRLLLSGLIFGLVVGFLLQRPFQRVADGSRFRRALAVGVVIALCIALDIPLILLSWELLVEARGFADQLRNPDLLPSLARALTQFGVPPETAASFVARATQDAGTALHDAALPTLGLVATLLMNTGVFLFVLYYTLLDGPRLAAWIHRALPLPPARASRLIQSVASRMRILFLGTFLVAIAHGALSGVIWWLLGFPVPVFWGAVMTVLCLVPALGPGIVMFPAGAIALATGHYWQGGALLAYGLIAAPMLDSVIRAVFVGKASGVHPALILIGTVGGLAVFGPSGFLLGPLILSMIDPVLAEWQRMDGATEGEPALPAS